MIKVIFASAVLAISSAATVQSATLIEIYGGENDVIFSHTRYPEYGEKGSTRFRFAFYDHNGDYIFNSGDTTQGGATYEQVNYIDPDFYDVFSFKESIVSSSTLSAGLDSYSRPFYYFNYEWFDIGYQEEPYFTYTHFSGYTKTTGYITAEYGEGFINQFHWDGYTRYDVKINGVSQVVPLPWPAALLPAGLALLGGLGRRRRVIG